MGLRRYNRDDMDFKHLKTNITYTIEVNPSGGFIARSTDPSIVPIEAPTAEELQKKVQTQLMGSIGTLLPGSNLPIMLAQAAAAGARKVSRTVTLATSNGNSVISKEASPEEVKQFAKQFAGIVQRDFPELARELAAKVEGSGSSSSVSPDGINPQTSLESGSNINREVFPQNAENIPILPETNGVWKLVGIFAFVLVLVLVFLLYAHH